MNREIRIFLLDFNAECCSRWKHYLQKIKQDNLELNWLGRRVSIETFCGTLSNFGKTNQKSIGSQVGLTAIVSPGNSLGFLRGGFDLAIAEFFVEDKKDFLLTESRLQNQIGLNANGYVPVGCARLVKFDEKHDISFANSKAWKLLRSNHILHIPTMAVPESLISFLSTDSISRLVFDCTWQILTTINSYNMHHFNDEYLETIVISGLGTGWGKVPYDICARSMITAIIIFTTAGLSPHEKSLKCLRFINKIK
ncbi:putative ADP-ribose 1''-phosphate phosphatase [Ascoidea rubescens DSM 1968]|uniref:Macro domain-like protein n=1 Tax=Ascoidea rubescens DSM 1968 TaxID=1344418 RepID=A0A1D2VBY6_9ASCO|nr:macro domain-like protein [Ascoidea rubescens DSM 1968]ODV59139.1 macro domain-like protein [Ascoidea rubescens DSM 1968]